MDLNLLWFFLVGVLIAGYAILDGFDFGVGSLHLFARNDTERRINMNSIGPFWDGNEVWLVTAGGALFAAFPEAYATAFSGFYLAFMLLLTALIFRAVALEFRSKRQSPAWRATWDWAFSLSSAVAAILFGVATGNMIMGIPIGADREYQGTFLQLLNPYSLLTGIFTLSVFVLHGAAYLNMKTEGDYHERVRAWTVRAYWAFVALYVVTTAVSVAFVGHATANLTKYPVLWLVVAINLFAIVMIPLMLGRRWAFRAFLFSALNIASLTALFGIALFPNLIHSSLGDQFTLTVYNAASSEKTLVIMRTIAAMGLPFVLAYTFGIYWVFRGKTRLTPTSY